MLIIKPSQLAIRVLCKPKPYYCSVQYTESSICQACTVLIFQKQHSSFIGRDHQWAKNKNAFKTSLWRHSRFFYHSVLTCLLNRNKKCQCSMRNTFFERVYHKWIQIGILCINNIFSLSNILSCLHGTRESILIH